MIKFISLQKESLLTQDFQTAHSGDIVFIEDSQKIWAKGKFYSDYKAAIKELKYFSSVSDGSTTASAQTANANIKFTGKGRTTVTVGSTGVEINTPADTLTTGTTDGSVAFNGTNVAIKGFSDLKTEVGNKVDNVIAGEGISVSDRQKSKIVSIAIDSTSTALVSTTSSGLKVNAPVTNVATGDKFLSLTDTKIGSTISISYDSQNKKINLYGKDTKTPVSSINCQDFIKDGMLNSAELVTNPTGQTAGTYIKLTFNTDSGKDPIFINVTSLIDVYDGSNVKLKAITVPGTYTAPTAGTTVDNAIANLIKKDNDLYGHFSDISTTVGVNKSTIDNYTVNTKKISGNPVLNGTDLLVGGTGSNKAKTVANAIEAIDTKITNKNVTAAGGTYVKATASGNKVTVTDKIQALASASTTAKGLAEASDVKAYVDAALSWIEITA